MIRKLPKLDQKKDKIIGIILEKGNISSSALHKELTNRGEDLSLVTVKRTLSEMVAADILTVLGSGRSTTYSITTRGRIFAKVNAHQYCFIEPDKRYGLRSYNFDLLPGLPGRLFADEELRMLDEATGVYRQRVKDLPPAIQKKELERLVIELSWKSSRLEGNTYTLLDTEKLILENKKAAGHDESEARMILNHKDAFDFVRENKKRFKTLSRTNLEELHAILVGNLSIGTGLRQKPVGVVGSIYRPLDNIHQINEAVETLSGATSRAATPYDKAILALLGIGYIQPFEDGNKRTSRLAANALLLAHDCAPLSYRSIDEVEYREAMFVFYELNSIVPFRKIFISQYQFGAQNYAVK